MVAPFGDRELAASAVKFTFMCDNQVAINSELIDFPPSTPRSKDLPPSSARFCPIKHFDLYRRVEMSPCGVRCQLWIIAELTAERGDHDAAWLDGTARPLHQRHIQHLGNGLFMQKKVSPPHLTAESVVRFNADVR